MATLLIDYDLLAPGKDYTNLLGAIKRYPWCHYLRSSWLVKAEMTPVQLCDELRQHIDPNDALFVVDVTGRGAAWIGLSDEISEWIKQNL